LLQLAAGGGVRLGALGAVRRACVIAFEPARIAVRVIVVKVRWSDGLHRDFRVRLAISFGPGRSAAQA
jgi:hypothetical protein